MFLVHSSYARLSLVTLESQYGTIPISNRISPSRCNNMPIRSRRILCQITICNISVTLRKCDRIMGCNIPADSSTGIRVKSRYCYVSVTSRFVDLTRFRVDSIGESWYDVDSARIRCSRFVPLAPLVDPPTREMSTPTREMFV
jgi:hypothetical protein